MQIRSKFGESILFVYLILGSSGLLSARSLADCQTLLIESTSSSGNKLGPKIEFPTLALFKAGLEREFPELGSWDGFASELELEVALVNRFLDPNILTRLSRKEDSEKRLFILNIQMLLPAFSREALVAPLRDVLKYWDEFKIYNKSTVAEHFGQEYGLLVVKGRRFYIKYSPLDYFRAEVMDEQTKIDEVSAQSKTSREGRDLENLPMSAVTWNESSSLDLGTARSRAFQEGGLPDMIPGTQHGYGPAKIMVEDPTIQPPSADRP